MKTQDALQQLRADQEIQIGSDISLCWHGLMVNGQLIYWTSISELHNTTTGLQIKFNPAGSRAASELEQQSLNNVDNTDLLMRVYDHFRTSAGTIGEVSAKIGMDVRELLMDGYTDSQIRDITAGRKKLTDVMQEGPKSEPQV